MIKTRLSLLVLSLLIGSTGFAQKMYIQCGKLIDGVAASPRSNVTLVVENKTITAIQDGFTSGSAADKIIDLKNKTVLPGLIDCHVHLESQYSKTSFQEGFTLTDADIAYRAAVNAKVTLLAGFTTVRDLGGSGVNIALRNAVNRGLTDGPYILTAGNAISATGGHMDESVGIRPDKLSKIPGPEDGVANGKEELVKAVRYQFKKGADVIKIASTGGVLDLSKDGSGAQFTVDEIKAVVETAKDYGMAVACHAHGAEGIRRAILGGVTSIEHGTYMDDDDIALAKKYGTWFVPTIIAGKSVADSAKIPGFFPAVVAKKAMEVGPRIQGTFAKAYKAGVKIAFGTDAGVYAHGKNAIEFQYMTEAGMPAMEAIQCATSRAADLLGIKEERGSIATGKMADIIAVDGDPLENVKLLTQVSFVMKEGKIYKQ
ncbi:metal-dependent hydrolase family protein [Deminuibacter soli]|uniref:Amidohydrolase family protein n=1 Tax=Deminuibacter soli TaxID=2291815 RepID=A0A3E1NQZ2_9BACT|nr:amidohydrolase family protein [Deminuibacter soli]RFM30352.1 amidohydrolase family protein [Deminuibacter soli]